MIQNYIAKSEKIYYNITINLKLERCVLIYEYE